MFIISDQPRSCLHDSGQQITAELTIQSLKSNFYGKNHRRRAGNGSLDSSREAFLY